MSCLPNDPVFGPALSGKGWVVRLAGPADTDSVMRLRAQIFRGGAFADDSDQFDPDCQHLWVGRQGQGLSATLRLRLHHTPLDVLSGYAAQVYDLTRLAGAGGPVLELGRLCSTPSVLPDEGDIMRLLWAGVARVVLKSGAKRLIGCTSFPTTDLKSIAPALSLLAHQHLGPDHLRPGRKAARTHLLPVAKPYLAQGLSLLPPLLRSYLLVGGWVSDHVVVDADLGTSHVFTCVDIATMPEARKRVLTRLAGL